MSPDKIGNDLIIEITDYDQPCRTIAQYSTGRKYGCISQKRNPGTSRLYAKVLTPGIVRRNERMSIVTRTSG